MKLSYSTNGCITVYIVMYLNKISGKLTDIQKRDSCQSLQCDETVDKKVCGIRKQDGNNIYKLFNNECLLLKYGCQVNHDEAYGMINMKYCIENTPKELNKVNCKTKCVSDVKDPICGIRKDGNGFRIKLFSNNCELTKYSCEKRLEFNITDIFICNTHNKQQEGARRESKDIDTDSDEEVIIEKDSFDNGTKEENKSLTSDEETNSTEISQEETSTMDISEEVTRAVVENFDTETRAILTNSREILDPDIPTVENIVENRETTLSEPLTTNINQVKNKTVYKNIVVVGASVADLQNINRTAANFFAATHVWDLPIRDVQPNITQRTRRMLIRIFGPVKVFKPWLDIPKTVLEDHYHKPTLSSCFHKCPTKCPDTYAPVCGVPGIVAREPSLMFQNHCFMDVAQCKMFWEDKSWTAETSAYIESSFLFCLGNELNGLYRFLPLIRTLQHMGRLKSKGKFKYKLKNMRFFNNLLGNEPNLMG